MGVNLTLNSALVPALAPWHDTTPEWTTDKPTRVWFCLGHAIRMLAVLLLATVVCTLFRLIIRLFRVEGSSMEPTLHQGQFLFVEIIGHCRPHRLHCRDIIIF